MEIPSPINIPSSPSTPVSPKPSTNDGMFSTSAPITNIASPTPTQSVSTVTTNEQQELFGREQLSQGQKFGIFLVTIFALGSVIGGGVWLYFAVHTQDTQNTTTPKNNIQNEKSTIQTDPARTDTDGDGLMDKQEQQWGTDVANPDTDGDGFKDGDEVSHGYSPLVPATKK